MIKTIDFNNEIFASIFKKMQINSKAPVNFKLQPYKFSNSIWSDMLKDGIRLAPAASGMPKNMSQADDGIYYQGQKVILYLSEYLPTMSAASNWQYLKNCYHIAWCEALAGLANSFYDKKVLTVSNSEQEKVTVRIYSYSGARQASRCLRICPHCLELLNWQGYRELDIYKQIRLRWGFNLEDYLRYQ